MAQLHTGVSKQRTGFMPTVGHSSFSLLPAVSVTLRAETRLRCVQGHVTTLLSRRTLGGFSGGSAATVSRKRRFSRTVRAYFSWVAYRPTNPSARLLRNTTLAFGPQHPAAHGILKIVLQLQGELVRHVDPQFGFLHRGTEKLMENRNFLQSLPYFDRFDYVANLTQEHAFCVALEALHPTVALTATTQLARALFDEVSRVLNHLLTLSATALDMSAMGPIFWAFEERENLMALLEQASGARMHTGLHRPFTFDVSVFTGVFFRDLSFFLSRCGRSISGAFLGLLNNRALRSRLSLVGQMTESKVLAYGLSGIPARSAGVLADRRLQTRMAATAYAYLNTRVFLGRRGDNLDRFVLRIKEAVEAFRALAQLQRLLSRPENPRLGVSQLTHTLGSSLRHCLRTRRTTTRLCRIVRGAAARTAAYGATLRPVSLPNFSFASSPTRSKFTSMEALISHFRLASEG